MHLSLWWDNSELDKQRKDKDKLEALDIMIVNIKGKYCLVCGFVFKLVQEIAKT